MLELNDVLLEGEPRTLSLMAYEGRLTCLTGGTAAQRSRWLQGMLGFVPAIGGYISIDGEPLTSASAPVFRQMMAYAPCRLCVEGQIRHYEPPTVQDVFALKANADIMVTNGGLNREIKMVGDVDEEQARWLAVAVLRGKPILLVEEPQVGAVGYLQMQAQKGRIVIVTSQEEAYRQAADKVVEINS